MSRSIQLIAKNVPGYGPSDGRCLPCSGVSGRAVSVSPCSSHGDYKTFSQVKIMSLKCASRSTFSVCNASSSSSHRRNPDFSRQNKHGFSRSRNRQNEVRESYENLEEAELLSSKNGPLPSVYSTPKFQATATPGPREKEIVELFRKVQAQLQERAAIKEEKKIEDLQGQRKGSETVDSLLKLLRKRSVQQGKRGSSRDFILDQPEQNVPFSVEKSPSFFDSNNTVKHGPQESKAPSVGRPISNFRRRSPVRRINFQSIYSDENIVNSVSRKNLDGKRKETTSELEPRHEAQLKVEPKPDLEPVFSDGDVFDEMSENERSDTDEGDIDDDAEEQNVVEHSDIDDDAEEQNVVEHMDLNGMKLPELRALAKSRGMKGFSKLKKRELVELLTVGSI